MFFILASIFFILFLLGAPLLVLVTVALLMGIVFVVFGVPSSSCPRCTAIEVFIVTFLVGFSLMIALSGV